MNLAWSNIQIGSYTFLSANTSTQVKKNIESGEKASNVFLENGEKADPNGRDSSHQ